VEQGHIADALVFELSKVEEPAIRERVVSHLPNIDEKLADRVAAGLGMTGKIQPAKAAVEPRRLELRTAHFCYTKWGGCKLRTAVATFGGIPTGGLCFQ